MWGPYLEGSDTVSLSVRDVTLTYEQQFLGIRLNESVSDAIFKATVRLGRETGIGLQSLPRPQDSPSRHCDSSRLSSLWSSYITEFSDRHYGSLNNQQSNAR